MIDFPFNKTRIYEKIVRSKDGRLARVRFIVAEIEGEIYGKIIGVESIGELEAVKLPIRNKQANSVKILALPCPKVFFSLPNAPIFVEKLVSPFSSLEFFISQLTRAPSQIA